MYRPARLHGLAEFIPWNRFLGSKKHLKIRARMSLSKINPKSTKKRRKIKRPAKRFCDSSRDEIGGVYLPSQLERTLQLFT